VNGHRLSELGPKNGRACRLMSIHHYQCPRCALLLQAAQDLSGRTVKCNDCKAVFTAPRVDRTESPPPLRTSQVSSRVQSRGTAARPARRSMLVVVAGGLVAATGLTVGVIAWTKTAKPATDSQPVALATNDGRDEPDEPVPQAPTVLPFPSGTVRYVRPEPGPELEEDLPNGPTSDGRSRERPIVDPTLPDIGVTNSSPAPPLPAVPQPKTDPPPPSVAPAVPAPAKTDPPNQKAAPTTPVEPKRPDPRPAVAASPVASKDQYKTIDAHALAAPPAVESSVASLAEYLARGAKSDREKARAIYCWITDRIAYDVEGFLSGQRPAPNTDLTLQRRMAICAGYATLFAELCKHCGLEAAVVTGYCKGLSDTPGAPVTKPDHAWSAVRLEDIWWIVDTTWGAGTIEGRQFHKEPTDYYFLVPPQQLAFTHLAEDAKWQLRTSPLTLAEFNNRPEVCPTLFQLGVTVEAVEQALRAPGYRDIVRTFRVPFPVTGSGDLPIGRFLKAGTEYRFKFKSDQAFSVVAIADNRSSNFKRVNGEFQATIRPKPGVLRIGTKARAGERGYAVLLEYVVE
jgi:transglutaminase-like putative cysteine protease